MRRWIAVATALVAALALALGFGAPSSATAFSDAGPDESIGRNVLFQLDGYAGADTGVRHFTWEQTSGPTDPVQVIGIDTTTPYLRYDTAGEYVWRLTVDDTQGGITTDEVTITITPEGRIIHPHHHDHGFQFNEYVRHHTDTLETCIKHKHIHMVEEDGVLVEEPRYWVPHGCNN